VVHILHPVVYPRWCTYYTLWYTLGGVYAGYLRYTLVYMPGIWGIPWCILPYVHPGYPSWCILPYVHPWVSLLVYTPCTPLGIPPYTAVPVWARCTTEVCSGVSERGPGLQPV